MLSRDAQRTEAADFAQQETIFTLYEHFQDTLQLGLPQSTGRFVQIHCMHNRDLRDKTLLDLPKVNSAIGQSTFKYAGAKDWNSLPLNIREIISFSKFKRTVSTHLLELDNNFHICSL